MASKAEAHAGQKKEAHKDGGGGKYGRVAVNARDFLPGPWATEPSSSSAKWQASEIPSLRLVQMK